MRSALALVLLSCLLPAEEVRIKVAKGLGVAGLVQNVYRTTGHPILHAPQALAGKTIPARIDVSVPGANAFDFVVFALARCGHAGRPAVPELKQAIQRWGARHADALQGAVRALEESLLHESLLDPSRARETAPGRFRVRLETTRGEIEIKVAEKLYGGYGNRPQANRIHFDGDKYLRGNFPELDYIKRAVIVKPR